MFAEETRVCPIIFSQVMRVPGKLLDCSPVFVLLKRVAYGKMQSQAILEFANIVITASMPVGRVMNGDTEVKAQYQEFHIIAEPGTCSKGEVAEESGHVQSAARTALILTNQPHISGIKEECALQTAK